MKLKDAFEPWFCLTFACSSLLLATAVGCGDEEDGGARDVGGEGGTAGTAGSRTSAGEKSTGGTSAGGTSGSSNAGSGRGGTDNAAGAAMAGGGGDVPTEPQGGAGGAGETGDGGVGGEPEPSGALHIVEASLTGPDRFYGTTVDAAGNIYAVGQIASSNDANADMATLIAKFTPAGALDATFGSGGFYVRNVQSGTSGELFRNLVVQSSGKIVAVGTVEHPGAADARDRDIALLRINADGTKDASFGNDGVVTLDLSTGALNGSRFSADGAWGIEKYADDRLVVSGSKVRDGGVDTDFVVARLDKDGVLDDGFATHGVFALDTAVTGVDHNNASARDLTILPGNEGIVAAGYQPKPGADTSPVLYKLTDGGVLDTTFGDAGVFHDSPLEAQTECYAAVVQPSADGGYKLVTTGYGRQLDTETTDLVSLRLTSTGQLDTSYGEGGLVRLDVGGFGDNSRKLLVLPDRRILLFGGGRSTSTDVDGLIAVLKPDGEPDAAFAPSGFRLFDFGGPADFLWSGALSPDHSKLVVVGTRGVGAAPMPPSAADDAVLLLLPAP